MECPHINPKEEGIVGRRKCNFHALDWTNRYFHSFIYLFAFIIILTVLSVYYPKLFGSGHLHQGPTLLDLVPITDSHVDRRSKRSYSLVPPGSASRAIGLHLVDLTVQLEIPARQQTQPDVRNRPHGAHLS